MGVYFTTPCKKHVYNYACLFYFWKWDSIPIFPYVRCIYTEGRFCFYTLDVIQVLLPIIHLYCLIRAKVESISCPEPLNVTMSLQSPRIKTMDSPSAGKRGEDVWLSAVPRGLAIHVIAPTLPGNLCACVPCHWQQKHSFSLLNIKEYSQVTCLKFLTGTTSVLLCLFIKFEPKPYPFLFPFKPSWYLQQFSCKYLMMNMITFQKRIQLIFLGFFPMYINRNVNNHEYTQSMAVPW